MVHIRTQFVNMNQATLALQVLSLAIITTLAAFVYVTIIKHKHYLNEPLPHSNGKASGMTQLIPQRLTLLQLVRATDADDLDAMVCDCLLLT